MADQKDTPAGPTARETFIQTYATKLEAEEKAGDSPSPESGRTEPGTAGTRADGRTPAPARAARDHAEDEGDGDEQDDRDEAEGDEADDAGEENDADDAAGEGDEADDRDEEDEGDEADDEDDDEGEDEDDPPAGKQRDDAALEAKSFEELAKKHGLPTEFKDVLKLVPDAAARRTLATVLGKKLAGMEAAFTRAQQEATQFRRDKAMHDAEVKWRDENKALTILEWVTSDAKLLDQVNAELDKIGEAKGYDEVVKHRREKGLDEARAGAAKAIDTAIAQRERAQTRGAEVQRVMEAAAAKEGVPIEATGIIEAIALKIRGSDKRDITDDEIREIVKERAKLWRRSVGGVKRTERREINKAKLRDQKKRPVVRPGGNHNRAPAASGKKPTSLREAMMATADKLFPGQG